MSNEDVLDLSHENERELAFKNLCSFEKHVAENISESNGEINISIDPQRLEELGVSSEELNIDFQTETFNSYEDLFNAKYQNNFLRNIAALNIKSLKSKLGANTLFEALKEDKMARDIYNERVKERDLDNDGVPDRIDIDDTKNFVQTVSDLSSVGNQTNKETAKDTDEKEHKKPRSSELEL